MKRADEKCGIALQREQTFQQNCAFWQLKTRSFQRRSVQSLFPTSWWWITILHRYEIDIRALEPFSFETLHGFKMDILIATKIK